MPGARVGGWEIFNSSKNCGQVEAEVGDSAQWLEAATRGDGVQGRAPAQWPRREPV